MLPTTILVAIINIPSFVKCVLSYKILSVHLDRKKAEKKFRVTDFIGIVTAVAMGSVAQATTWKRSVS